MYFIASFLTKRAERYDSSDDLQLVIKFNEKVKAKQEANEVFSPTHELRNPVLIDPSS